MSRFINDIQKVEVKGSCSERCMVCAMECVMTVQGHRRLVISLPIKTRMQRSISDLKTIATCPI